ncbi:glycoside hydrolase family 47 protein [Gelatoporia subvermispora B]|uniref:alpha-1,2-Mannosidase n=1 Tax=Ceriporiopsis subvermispora (strain B) TaxID=914234 RepID=M2RD46_CERS8|nr:glycoside hydrolase family 47 protein [Gelatoporia subvermispora B]
MSTEPGLRQRRKDASPKNESKETVTAGRATSGPVSVRSILLLSLAAVSFYIYQNAATVRSTLNLWAGYSDSAQLYWGGEVDFVPDLEKRDAVGEAMLHAWSAYERDAMGDDEYHPISRTGSNLTEAGGIGYTVVDSIDTLLIMGLDEEYKRARDWIENKLTFDQDAKFNTFETTIRVLGGLLSAHHLTDDTMFLEKAKDLADRIMPVFETPSGLPLSMVNLAKREGVPDVDNKGLVSTAEVSTLQLEFRYLALLTDNETYWEKAEHVMSLIKKAHISTGLASIFMNPEDGRFVLAAIRLGSRGDSYYEYLLKQYLQTNLTEVVYKDMYDDAMNGVHNHLIQKSQFAKLTYTSELIPERNRMGEVSWRLTPKQDHLVCFLGGSLMLGAVTTGAVTQPVSLPPRPEELSPQGQRDWATGIELVETCMRTHDTATGLSPEIAHFRIPSDNMDGTRAPHDWYIKGDRPGAPAPYDARYILRPETVESLFVAYRLTGNPRYRQYGWDIFQAIEKYCKIEGGGYASILNVDRLPIEHEDKMETFFMSETLKYLYLLFEDVNVLPLSKYVFNTEAHPLPIFHPTIRTGFS